ALDVRVEIGDMFDPPVDQFLAEGVVLAWFLAVFEKHAQVLGEIFRLVEAPRVKKLQGGHAAVAALGKLDLAHRENSFFSAAIASAARPNSAPRLIRPAHRTRAWASVAVTITPLITGTVVS